MQASPLSGPRLEALQGQTKSLVIFLHGYGADGNDLIDIARHWQADLPQTAFVSPHAPEPCAMSPMGRQWFALTMRDESEFWRGVQKAAPVLQQFIEAEQSSYNLSPDKIALVGFSQGCMMALHAALHLAPDLAAVVGLSGLLAGAEHTPQDMAKAPKILLAHGTHDEVIPFQAMLQSLNALNEAGLGAEYHIAHGIGHGIDSETIKIAGHFLQKSLEK